MISAADSRRAVPIAWLPIASWNRKTQKLQCSNLGINMTNHRTTLFAGSCLLLTVLTDWAPMAIPMGPRDASSSLSTAYSPICQGQTCSSNNNNHSATFSCCCCCCCCCRRGGFFVVFSLLTFLRTMATKTNQARAGSRQPLGFSLASASSAEPARLVEVSKPELTPSSAIVHDLAR